MAATLTPAGELTFISFPITKFEETSDGNLYVYGKATDGSVDSDEQIVDTDWSPKAIADWLASGANVRVQHNAQRDPAGVGVEVNTASDGATWVKSLVVEPTAKTLVRHKALRAYSVGIARPKIVRDSVARGGRIVDGEIVEISLVDRPANKNCGIELVKADKDGNAEFTGKMFGDQDMLTKAAKDEETVTIPASTTFTPGDLMKLLEHRRIAEKRQMDPSVGGGVDRDKLPAGDFAGRDRSFPIVTPGDVSDAVSSIGRAGASNYSSDKLKRNIIRIARRKGDAFVAELPESWKKELGIKAEDDTEMEKDGGAFPGAHPGFTEGHQPPHDERDDQALGKAADDDVDTEDDGEDEDEDAKKGEAMEAKPDATKGMKDCKGCGAAYDGDSKLRRCAKCDMKLPMASKARKPKVMCPGCGANQNARHGFCTECGKSMKDATPSTLKNHKFTCLTCHREPLDKGERYCPGCGTENPGYLSQADAQLKVQKGATPGAGVVGTGAADIEPVPAHREPDGAYIEALESDAGMETVPDSTVQLKAATRLKSIGVTNEMGALHDLLCPAFRPVDAAKAHPAATLTTLDTGVWQAKASDAVFSGTIEDAGKAAQLWQAAETIKGTDPSVLSELRDEAHKSFQDANPGPGTFPTPMELSPTRFRRPLLTGGHAAASPGHDGPNTAAIPSSAIDAAQFQRGYLDAGRAADSPSNKGADILPAPVPTGVAQRTYYRNTQRDAARSAMVAMHDHIAQMFPDLCSMGGPGHGGEAPVNAHPVPSPVGAAKTEDAAEVTAVADAKPKVKKAKKDKTVTKAASVVGADAIKSAVLEATRDLATQVTEITKVLEATQAQNKQLAAAVEALGNLPDPNVAAFRGVGFEDMATKSSAAPVGLPSVAETAERQQAALMRALTEQARNSPNPSEREAAWAKLYHMNGLG